MLYKKRYLICLIDIYTDNIVSVYDNAVQFSGAYKVDGKTILSKAFNKDYIFKKRYKIEFIDCYQKQDDIFKEEDEIFLKFIEEKEAPTIKELCEFKNISNRTFYRRQNKIKDFKELCLKSYNEVHNVKE